MSARVLLFGDGDGHQEFVDGGSGGGRICTNLTGILRIMDSRDLFGLTGSNLLRNWEFEIDLKSNLKSRSDL